MDIQCRSCKSQFKVPDGKIPPNQVVKLTCPKCKNKIQVDTRPKPNAGAAGGKAAPQRNNQPSAGNARTANNKVMNELDKEGYDASDRPFDFVEAGTKTALLCEQNSDVLRVAKEAVSAMGFHATAPETAREALKQMRFHTFDLVILNEKFDTDSPDNNHVHKFLSRMNMSQRRNVFVVLISDTYRTMDDMAAYNRSVNLVMNTDHVSDMPKILKKGLSDFEFFYKVYREAQKKTGKT
ncbi:MAG: zinc-ribbon domain-containing protein [Deltaproteobacteria bacterium]|nr:zinc-ribbon domain-containing protein [Deltaproteobacteria bacterium]